MRDRVDPLEIIAEEHPRFRAGVDTCLVGVPDARAELVATKIVPGILDWIQLRRVGRQRQ